MLAQEQQLLMWHSCCSSIGNQKQFERNTSTKLRVPERFGYLHSCDGSDVSFRGFKLVELYMTPMGLGRTLSLHGSGLIVLYGETVVVLLCACVCLLACSRSCGRHAGVS